MTIEQGIAPNTPDEDEEEAPKKGRGKKTGGEKPAGPSRSRGKNKEPAKAQIDVVASTTQDVYSLIDAGLNMYMTSQGIQYPDGLFDLDDETAAKMARAMIKMNDALPRVVEKTAKYTAPLGLAAVVLTDLSAKGAILYGLVQDKKRRDILARSGFVSETSASDQRKSLQDLGVDSGPVFPFNTNGGKNGPVTH